MISEKAYIEAIDKILPRSERQLNRCFESDAEWVLFEAGTMAVNMDAFSEEDHLAADNPYVLGWNMTVGSISDILASGGIPMYYGHCLTIGPDWDIAYVKDMAKGIGDALKAYDVAFIGGDFGRGSHWHYATTTIGRAQGKPLGRNGANVGDGIYITGQIGTGNLEAAVEIFGQNAALKSMAGRFIPKYQVRRREAEYIRRYATSAIDTSDGVLNGLLTLAKGSGCGFKVSQLPYLKVGEMAAKMLKLPKELLMAGECGEYELLFTVPRANETALKNEIEKQGLSMVRIGEITGDGYMTSDIKNGVIDWAGYDISARAYQSRRAYLDAVMDYMDQHRTER